VLSQQFGRRLWYVRHWHLSGLPTEDRTAGWRLRLFAV